MDKKKIIIIVIILLIVAFILMLTSSKKDEFREKDIQTYVKIYIPEQISKCLKAKKYSLETPTAEQKAECEAFAKAKWDEIITMNSEED